MKCATCGKEYTIALEAASLNLLGECQDCIKPRELEEYQLDDVMGFTCSELNQLRDYLDARMISMDDFLRSLQNKPFFTIPD